MFDNLLSKCSLIIIFVVFLIVVIYKSSNISENFQNNSGATDFNSWERERRFTQGIRSQESDNQEVNSQESEERGVTNSESNYQEVNSQESEERGVTNLESENDLYNINGYLDAMYPETEETSLSEETTMEEQLPRRIHTSEEEERTLKVIDAESHLDNELYDLTEDELWLLSDEGQVWLSTIEGLDWMVNTEEGQEFWRLICKFNDIEPIFCDFFAELRKLTMDCQNSHPEDPSKCLENVWNENNCKRLENHCNRYYQENNIDVTSPEYRITDDSPMTEQICAISGFLCAWNKFKNSQSKDVKVGNRKNLYKDTFKVVRSFISKASEKVNPPNAQNSHWPAGGFDPNNKKDESLMSKCLGDDILRQREYIISRPVPINKDGTCNYHDGQYHLSNNLKLCRSCAPGEKINFNAEGVPSKGGSCEPCGPDTISNKRNSKECIQCPPGTKPNKSKTECVTCEGGDCQTYLPEGNYVLLNKYRENKIEMQKRINNLTKKHDEDINRMGESLKTLSNTL